MVQLIDYGVARRMGSPVPENCLTVHLTVPFLHNAPVASFCSGHDNRAADSALYLGTPVLIFLASRCQGIL